MKGQEFAVFKMLIGAVFAVGLLMLIYAVVSGMNYPISGVEETRNLLLQAKRAPGTSAKPMCFERSIIKFTKGEEFTDAVLGFERGLTFVDMPGTIDCSASSGCIVSHDIELTVSAQCQTPTSCEVRFGRPCP